MIALTFNRGPMLGKIGKEAGKYMKALHCDTCKESVNTPLSPSHLAPNWVRLNVIWLQCEGHSMREIDLCPDCARRLNQWLEENGAPK